MSVRCASANGSGRSKGTVSHTVPNAMSCYRPRLLVCVYPPPIRLWRVCAFPQTQPLYALSALTVVRVSLFRNTGACAPLFGTLLPLFKGNIICAQRQHIDTLILLVIFCQHRSPFNRFHLKTCRLTESKHNAITRCPAVSHISRRFQI